MRRSAEKPTDNMTGLEQTLHGSPGHIARNSEAHADAPAGRTGDGRIDPHQFSIEGHQGPAGVAWIDGGIGLNEIFEIGDTDIGATDGTDNAERHTAAQPKGVSDRQHKFADGERTRIPPCHCRQIGRLNFYHGHVGFRIGGHHSSFVLPPVGENHFHIDRIGNDMVIRHNVAIRRHNDTGALAILPPRRRILEQSERQRFVAERLISNHHRGSNADDSRNHFGRGPLDLRLEFASACHRNHATLGQRCSSRRVNSPHSVRSRFAIEDWIETRHGPF